MCCSNSNRQCINTGSVYKLFYKRRVCISFSRFFYMNILLMTSQHTKFCLYRAAIDAVRAMIMCKISNLLGFCNIRFKILLGSIDHNISKTCYNSLFNLLHICCMIQMQTERNFRISLCDSFCSFCNQFQGTNVFNCSYRSHQNNRCIFFTSTFYETYHLRNRTEVKCTYCISVLRICISSSKSYRIGHNLFNCK